MKLEILISPSKKEQMEDTLLRIEKNGPESSTDSFGHNIEHVSNYTIDKGGELGLEIPGHEGKTIFIKNLRILQCYIGDEVIGLYAVSDSLIGNLVELPDKKANTTKIEFLLNTSFRFRVFDFEPRAIIYVIADDELPVEMIDYKPTLEK